MDEMEQYTFNVAKTIYSQLLASCNGNTSILYSWGISNKVACTYNEHPTLSFNVNGFIHKGKVNICYNRGTDLYDIYFIDKQNVVVKSVTDIYFDQLASIVDSNVEYPKGMSVKEYERLFNKEYGLDKLL